MSTIANQPTLCRADINGAMAFWLDDQDNPMIEVIEGINWMPLMTEIFTWSGVGVFVPNEVPHHIRPMALLARFGDDEVGHQFPPIIQSWRASMTTYKGQGNHTVSFEWAPKDTPRQSEILRIAWHQGGRCVKVHHCTRSEMAELSTHLQQIARLCDFLGINFELK